LDRECNTAIWRAPGRLSFYTVRIAVPPEELARLQGPKLIPDMPVEVYI
jgi:hypothetical protein